MFHPRCYVLPTPARGTTEMFGIHCESLVRRATGVALMILVQILLETSVKDGQRA
jgi:hypothetical protein